MGEDYVPEMVTSCVFSPLDGIKAGAVYRKKPGILQRPTGPFVIIVDENDKERAVRADFFEQYSHLRKKKISIISLTTSPASLNNAFKPIHQFLYSCRPWRAGRMVMVMPSNWTRPE